MIRINSLVALFGILAFFQSFNSLADEFTTLHECEFIETEWHDGDSFLVRDATGKEFTIRLYGVDCIEYHVHDETDARRLRAQRRYFGISRFGGSSQRSIESAKQFGALASERVRQELDKPFTVMTAFADGRGDGKHKRYYGFVTTSQGEDLGEKLVRLGLARAYGVYRQTPDGRTREEHRDWLKDIELQAAKRGAGVWAATNWDSLPEERRQDREELAELELALQGQPLDPEYTVNLNTAARDELMKLPGIGEVIANRIIERRPFANVELIIEVDGIGPKTLERLRSHLKLVD